MVSKYFLTKKQSVWFAKVYLIMMSRAGELSRITGLEAQDIYMEMAERRMTPGEWAEEHDLDKITFAPLPRFLEDASADCPDRT